MKSTTEKVDDLKGLLEIKAVDVATEVENTNILIEKVGKETVDAEKEEEIANI